MMDSTLQASPPGNTDTKSAFRKPSGDAANRNYRRHSPIDESPSSDASPKRERRASPSPLREDSVRVSDHHSRKDDGREQDRHYGRNHYSRSSDSFRHSDRQSSRTSHGHSRHEEYIRQDKYADEDRYHERLSSRYGHESRGDRAREEGESRSNDYLRGVEKYSRDKFDRSDYRSKEKDRETSSLEHHKCKDKDSSSDRSGYGRRHAASDDVKRERHTRDWEGRDERRDSYRSDLSNSESRRQRDDSESRRDSGKRHLKDAYKSEHKEQDGQMIPWEEKKKYDDFEISKNRDRNPIKLGEQFGNEDNESYVKKQKLFDKGDNDGKDDERKTSSSKLSQDSNLDLKTAHATGSEGSSDLNAAKVAAMKAAELVNRNLVGVGCLTTDQKKKLLWGSKKNTTAEESGHRWDASLFSDRERQEKFNKLMSLRLDWCLWPIVGCERRPQGGAKFQQPTWQRSSPCREAEGTPAGSRETVHCRSATKRWPYSWIRSLNIYLGNFSCYDICNVCEFDASMLRKILLLVCYPHRWEFMYVLLLDTSSLGNWWEFLDRQKKINVMEIPVVIVSLFFFSKNVSKFLLQNSFNSGLGNSIHVSEKFA